MEKLNQIFKRLKMDRQNGLFITAENKWHGILPPRFRWLIDEKLKPTAFFCLENKPLILFYDSPASKGELFRAIWNFNESPVVIINEPDTVEIFNGFSYLKDESTLKKLEDEENLDKFSYFELITGKSLEKYHRELKYQNRVDYHLLDNIRAARDLLKEEHKIENTIANALIGKCIFVRYLIDRKVRIKFDGELQEWRNVDFCELLSDKKRVIGFFKYLQGHFNGEAFLINDSELHKVSQKAFDVLRHLLEGTEIKSGQRTLFDIYDFSIIPVEFISNVYEFFIGEENQAKKGAYYTPKFLVDYILADTVEKYFDENSGQYNCKVLDPACGSGIFLVEALRRIIEQYLSLNNDKISKKVLKKLAEDNIFGIDEDINAINVAIFSIYLALLDYQEPKDIEDFTFPKLLQNGNFFEADFFDTNAKYNSRFGEIEFDFIIGNPPWKRGAFKEELFVQYIEDRKQKENEFNKANDAPEPTISNNEIAQAFLLRTSDFSNENTKCALIVTSKILYNLNAKKFRCYFLHNYFVDKVFELAPARREVFDKSNDKAIAPATILFFRYAHGSQTDVNLLIHLALKPNRFFSLFKVFVLQRNDIKKVVQKRLKEYDYLWKILVYGSYLDFNFLRRLKTEYKTIADIVVNKGKLSGGQGVMVDGGDENDATHLIGLPLLNTREDVKQFFINPCLDNKWYLKVAHRPKEKELFTAPALLIKGGINNKFESISAISYVDCVFKSSLTGIKLGGRKVFVLQILSGLLNSELFSYNILNTGSSAGIEREESEDEEKWSLPFIENIKIAEIVKQIENVSKQIYKEKQRLLKSKAHKLETERQKLINQLSLEIFNSFDLDEQERTLVDYAVNVTIPLIMKHKRYEQKLFSPFYFKDKLLEDYINIFLSRFAALFREKHLKAEIWHAIDIVGIFFKVVPDSTPDQQTIEWQQKTNETLLNKIVSLGIKKVTEELFIQKDVRGFEKKGFYIIKPNEKRLWHKAIGYLDVDEFMDAILKAGKEEYNG